MSTYISTSPAAIALFAAYTEMHDAAPASVHVMLNDDDGSFFSYGFVGKAPSEPDKFGLREGPPKWASKQMDSAMRGVFGFSGAYGGDPMVTYVILCEQKGVDAADAWIQGIEDVAALGKRADDIRAMYTPHVSRLVDEWHTQIDELGDVSRRAIRAYAIGGVK